MYHSYNKSKQIENNIIDQILHNNKYDSQLNRKPLKSITSPENPAPNTKWAHFTYFGKETRYITKLFHHTPIKVAYTTKNTLQKLLFTPTTPVPDKYSRSGVYKLTCPDCKKIYTGQTGRPFSTRFWEHYQDYIHGQNKSKFAEHLVKHCHSFGPIDTVMKPIYFTSKGRIMNTTERFHIYGETRLNNQINDWHTVQPNAIFEALVLIHSDEGH
jgi:hypothetical protein